MTTRAFHILSCWYNGEMQQQTMRRPVAAPQPMMAAESSDIALSVIIPAYNEEGRVGKTIDIISAYLLRQSYTYEIVVVNNGSTDRTAEVVRQKMGTVPHLLLMEEDGVGKGDAVRAGMLGTTGAIRLFTDADNSTDISHVEKMWPLFERGYEVVICSRDAKDAKGAHQAVSQVWFKRQLGNMGNLFIQIMAVPGIWDTQCGFKAFRAEAAERIFSQMRIQKFGFDVEALALARFLGYRIGIVPAYWVNDVFSHVSLKSYLEVLWEVVRVRWNFIRSRYTK